MAALVVVLAGLRAAQDLALPLLFSVMLAILTLPAVRALERLRVPRGVAIMLVVLGVLGGLVSATAAVARSLQEFTARLPLYQARIGALASSTVEWAVSKGLPEEAVEASDLLDPGQLMGLVGATLGSVVGFSSSALLVVLVLSFILFEASTLSGKFHAAFGEGGVTWTHLAEAAVAVQKYLGIKTVISLVTGALLGVFTHAMGLDFALIWGIIAFLLNYIPTIGSIIAAVPAVLVALVQQGPGPALVVALGYLAVNVLLGSLLEPRLLGRRLGLSPLIVFLSLVFWGWLWGPAGMLLSVPLTVMVKIVLEHSPSTRWIAVLLGPAREALAEAAAAEAAAGAEGAER